MRSVVRFVTQNEKPVIIIYLLLWSVVISCFGAYGQTQSGFSIFICIFFFASSVLGYLLMGSYKFGLVFPIIFLLGCRHYIFDGCPDVEMWCRTVVITLVLSISLIVKRLAPGYIKILVTSAILLFIMFAVCFFFGGIIDVKSVAGNYARIITDAFAYFDRIIICVTVLFGIFTVIRKARVVRHLVRIFINYLMVFAVVFLVIGALQVYLQYPLNSGISLMIQMFFIYFDYILLTMWWHPGHYYKQYMEAGKQHRFDIYADDYRDIHTDNVKKVSGEESDYFTEYKIVEISRYMENAEAFLDFGCGDGNTGVYFTKRYGCDYYGIDVSSESIRKANERNLPGCVFMEYDGVRIPFEDDKFDVVFMACVLHHIDPDIREGLLRECRRVLKPGGKMIIFEHNPWNIITCNTVDRCAFDEDAMLLSPWDTKLTTMLSGISRSRIYYTLFMPRKGVFRKLLFLEKYLKWLPIGAQYYLVGDK